MADREAMGRPLPGRRVHAGPVPIRAAKVRGHEMSVRTVCLGWHWHPYAYTRDAVDVNGRRAARPSHPHDGNR